MTVRIFSHLVGIFTLILSSAAIAQTSFPSQPVRLIVGFVPGGGTDVSARILAKGLVETLGTQIVVENRPGASGLIASDQVAKSEPDGYTLLLANMQSTVASPHLVPVTFDPVHAFTAVHYIGSVPNVLVINPEKMPVTRVGELIARVKAQPGAYTYASSGLGSPQHLSAARFSQRTGVTMEHVPYKGSGQAVADLLGGQVHMNFDTLPSVIGHIASGRLRALAVTSAKRAQALPSVPTLAEEGVKGMDIVQWYAVLAPAGLPPNVLARLDQAIGQAIARPDVSSSLATQGMTVGGGPDTPAAFQVYIRDEYDKYGRIIRDLGLSLKP